MNRALKHQHIAKYLGTELSIKTLLNIYLVYDLLIPIFASISSARHQFVKDDCNKFNPTKSVRRSQYGLI